MNSVFFRNQNLAEVILTFNAQLVNELDLKNSQRLNDTFSPTHVKVEWPVAAQELNDSWVKGLIPDGWLHLHSKTAYKELFKACFVL